jgi:hypothetical protein
MSTSPTGPELEAFSIFVQASPETGDHEVCLRSDGQDLIARFDNSMIGLDPDDILVAPSPLQASATPHTATIGRCDCGVVECGSVEVLISREGSTVCWSSPHSATSIRFDAAQYAAELERALADFSWETPDRTAARLISRGVDRQHLAANELKFLWASGRIGQRQMTVALSYQAAYQLLVHVHWEAGRTPEAIATDCLQRLLEPPQSWERVEWLPQRQALGAPELAGPGWSRATR